MPSYSRQVNNFGLSTIDGDFVWEKRIRILKRDILNQVRCQYSIRSRSKSPSDH